MNLIDFLRTANIGATLKEKNNAYILCPRCMRDNLSINVFSGVWQCWSAECSASDPPFVGSFPQLVKFLNLDEPPTPISFSAPPEVDKTLTEEDRLNILNAATRKADVIEWATSRALDSEFCIARGIGYDDAQRAIVFPYHDDKGVLIGAKYKSERGQWIRGEEPKLYVLDIKDLKKEKIVLVEGEEDALTLKQLGIAVAATLGATKTKGFNLLNGMRQVYIGFDMDPGGESGATKAASELGHYRCKRVKWKDKDVNDWLKAGGTKEEIVEAVKSAKSMALHTGSLTALEALNSYFEEHEKGVKPRRSWGFPRLDSFTKGLGGGELIGVLAESGTGKTTFILNVIRNHVTAGIRCGFASLEEHPIHEITPKLYSCLLARNINMYGLSRKDAKEVEKELKMVQLYNRKAELREMIDWVKECYYKHDCKMVAVDYLQLLVRDEESVQAIKETVFSIKDLTKEMHELCIILIIQPKQKQKGRTKDGLEAPPIKLDGADARGGSAINQTVDKMLTIRSVNGQPNITQYEYTKARGHLNVSKKDWLNKSTQLEYDHNTLRMTERDILIFN